MFYKSLIVNLLRIVFFFSTKIDSILYEERIDSLRARY